MADHSIPNHCAGTMSTLIDVLESQSEEKERWFTNPEDTIVEDIKRANNIVQTNLLDVRFVLIEWGLWAYPDAST